MKKFISLLIATAVSLTAFVSIASANAITTDNKATLTVTCAKVDWEDPSIMSAADAFTETDYDSYECYRFTITAGNVPGLTYSKKKYFGEGITSVSAGFTIATDGEKEVEWDLFVPAGQGSFTPNGSGGYGFSYMPQNDLKKLVIASTSNVTAGASQDLATFDVVITKDVPVAIDFISGQLSAATYDTTNGATAGNGANPYAISAEIGNLTVNTETFNLPLSAPTTTYTYTFRTYDDNGTGTPIATSTLDAGDAVVAPTAPTRTGYTFVGWATSAGGAAVTIDTTATADTTYYAVYSKDPVPVTGVSLDKSELTFKVGDAAQTLTATVDPSDADVKTVEWSTSDTSVATVENGVVTPVGAGKATITVASTENSEKSASCTVKVNPADVASANFKEIANGTSLADLTGKPIDASKNYGAGRINTDIDTGVFSYQVVATDDKENEKTWDLPSGLEVAGNVNFIAIVKSATHVIKNIFLRGTVK